MTSRGDSVAASVAFASGSIETRTVVLPTRWGAGSTAVRPGPGYLPEDQAPPED